MGPVVRYALSLSDAERPRVCWPGTAHGDDLAGIRVTDTPGRAAYRVSVGDSGELLEQLLQPDLLS